MQNWEEYEADYYGGCPCERAGAGRENGRRSRPIQAWDYPDRRFLGTYGGEVYDENAYDGNAYAGREYGGNAYAGREYGGNAYAGGNHGGKPEDRRADLRGIDNRRPYASEEYRRGAAGRDTAGGRSEDNNAYPGGRLSGESREEAWDDRQWAQNGAGRREAAGRTEIAGRTVENDRAGYRVTDEEVWKDLDEFEGLYDELEADITEVIRRICDTIDGDGCAAMDGQLSREMLELLIDRVLEQLRQDGQPENGGRVRDGGQPENGSRMEDGTWPENGSRMRDDGQSENGSRMEEGTWPENGSRMRDDSQSENGSPMEEGAWPERGNRMEESTWPEKAGQTTGDSEGEVLEAETVSVNDAEAVKRSLVSSLLFHELLRRRMRRRMHRRNRRGEKHELLSPGSIIFRKN